MVGGPEGDSDQLLDVVRAIDGGCFYVPSAAELGLATGLDPRFYRPAEEALSSWDHPAMNCELSNGGPVDLNIREDFPLDALQGLIRAYADGRVGANLLTLTCADPDTYAAAADQPERYELVRVRMGGWTEFFAAMFPAHHEQHRRRPFIVP